MIPASFEYVRPGSLEESLAILRDREGEAKVLSGGYSLLPLMKLRLRVLLDGCRTSFIREPEAYVSRATMSRT